MIANYTPQQLKANPNDPERSYGIALDPSLLFHNAGAASAAGGSDRQVQVPRGTVSMPTSPLMRHSHSHLHVTANRPSNITMDMNINVDQNVDLWNVPHTAQPYFGPSLTTSTTERFFPFQGHASPLDLELSPQAQAWYNPTSTSDSNSNQDRSNPITGSSRLFDYEDDPLNQGWEDARIPPNKNKNKNGKKDTKNEQTQNHDHDHEQEEGQERGYGPGGRKKRAQVRIACTHCQKACKKCSNTRPCERCVKFGLQDCVDSTRKARKTGVKRGPYKRRASKFDQYQYQYQPSPTSHSQAQIRRQSDDHTQIPNNTRSHINADVDLDEMRYSDVPPPQPQRQLYQPTTTTTTTFTQPHIPNRTETDDQSDVLAHAISSALTNSSQKPKWINGQRLSSSSNQKNSIPSPMYPRTPAGPFPLTLNNTHSQLRGGDPFSRAVSPIHGSIASVSATATATRAVFWRGNEGGWIHPQESDEHQDGCLEKTNSNNEEMRLSIGSTTAHSQSLDNIGTTIPLPQPKPKSTTHKSPPDPCQGQNQVHANGTYTPCPYPLPKKIRKPSLRTLISTTTTNSTTASRAPSPRPTSHQQLQQYFRPSHISEEEEEVERIQSPTLFDQPMTLDDDALGFLNYKLENWSNQSQSQPRTANDSAHVNAATDNGLGSAGGNVEHPGGEMFTHKSQDDGNAGSASMLSFDSLVHFQL